MEKNGFFTERQKKILINLLRLDSPNINVLYDCVKKDMAKGTFQKELEGLEKIGVVERIKQKNRQIVKLTSIFEFEEIRLKDMRSAVEDLLNQVKGRIKAVKDKRRKADLVFFASSAITTAICIRLQAVEVLHSNDKVKEWVYLRYLELLREANANLAKLLVKECGEKLSKEEVKKALQEAEKELKKTVEKIG